MISDLIAKTLDTMQFQIIVLHLFPNINLENKTPNARILNAKLHE